VEAEAEDSPRVEHTGVAEPSPLYLAATMWRYRTVALVMAGEQEEKSYVI
jgi:hypothetical protein